MDDTDKKLLTLLTRNGRMTQAALASEVGLSRPSVIDRIRKLEEAGIIQGYIAHLDRRKLGKPICAIVSVHFRSGTISEDEEMSIKELADDPDIIECHKVAGEESAILKIVTSSIESLEQVLNRIRELDAISSTKTNVVLSSYFEKPGVQI